MVKKDDLIEMLDWFMSVDVNDKDVDIDGLNECMDACIEEAIETGSKG